MNTLRGLWKQHWVAEKVLGNGEEEWPVSWDLKAGQGLEGWKYWTESSYTGKKAKTNTVYTYTQQIVTCQAPLI